MVGDNMLTDMAFGSQCGFVNVLPLTGVTSESDLAAVLGSEVDATVTAPDFVLDSVACLARHLLPADDHD